MTSVTINLTPIPTGNNGSSIITSYILLLDNGFGDDGSFVVKSDSLSTTISIGNLIPGRTYIAKYAGRNTVYDSNNLFGWDALLFSSTTSFTTAISPDSPMNLIQSSLRSRTSILVQWNSPISTGGSPLTSYDLKITDASTASTSSLSISPALSSYKFLSLIPGKEYDISIRSNTAFDTSDYSDVIVVYPGVIWTSPLPAAFSSTSRNSIVMSWTALSN